MTNIPLDAFFFFAYSARQQNSEQLRVTSEIFGGSVGARSSSEDETRQKDFYFVGFTQK